VDKSLTLPDISIQLAIKALERCRSAVKPTVAIQSGKL
jgi:hypothetical protein